jgi:hypothetical protein
MQAPQKLAARLPVETRVVRSKSFSVAAFSPLCMHNNKLLSSL